MIMHISADIEGLLQNFMNKSMDGIFTDKNGNSMTDAQARIVLTALLNKGDKFIPSKGCNNFDPQKGCLCHLEAKK